MNCSRLNETTKPRPIRLCMNNLIREGEAPSEQLKSKAALRLGRSLALPAASPFRATNLIPLFGELLNDG